MNVERILALADLIEQQPHTTTGAEHGFTMSEWTHDCGTPACIAGWAAWEAEERPHVIDWKGADIRAANFLCIPDDIADGLFEPGELDAWSSITPSQAAATLRHLAATGEVDWYAKAKGSADSAGEKP